MGFFHNASRWLFLAALIYAPWAYGCTAASEIRVLNIILAIALGFWGIALAAGYWLPVKGYPSRRRRRSVAGYPDNQEPITDNLGQQRWALFAPCALLLLFGWWMTANAGWVYDSDYFLFARRAAYVGVGPGSVDYVISLAWMIRATLLLGVVWFAVVLSRDPVWLVRLWWTMAVAGGSIALLGLVQKATGAPMVFWEAANPPRKTFFASYYAHGNAGAYLNLVLPVTIVLALRSFLRKSVPLVRAASVVLCLLIAMATIANTSRGGQAVALLMLLVLPICVRDLLISRARRVEKKTLLLAAGVVGFAVVAIAGVSQWDQSLGRWDQLEQKLEGDSRWLATRAAVGAIPDAGWFGFGPGTFRVVFPYYTNGLEPGVGGIWRFLHQDYLQTLMEWGWVGSACWAVLFFGGMWVAVRKLQRRQAASLTGRERLFLTGSVLALAGIALHALVDFPLQIASLQLYVATYVGVCWGLRPEG